MSDDQNGPAVPINGTVPADGEYRITDDNTVEQWSTWAGFWDTAYAATSRYEAERYVNDKFRVACLGPEPEPVSEATGFDDVTAAKGGDGWDFIADSDKGGMWRSHASWGLDGWDIGDWPLVTVQSAQEGTGEDISFLVRTRVEGDLDVWRFRTQEEAFAKIDHIAWFYWLSDPSRYSEENMTREVMGADVDRFRGPFSWARLNATKAQS